MRTLIAALALAVCSHGLAAAEEAAGPVELPTHWAGDANFVTEPFVATGPISVTLAAWCFEGVGFVRAAAFDADGHEVGHVMVLGEGIESDVLDVVPGEYTLEVTVSHTHTYTWEILVEDAETVAEADPDGEAVPEGATGGPDGPTVEVPHAWQGDDAFATEWFETEGDWELLLGAWCHEGVSFVTATAFDRDGQVVDSVTVIGEGVRSAVLATPPGFYRVEVSSPAMDIYHWELVVQPPAEE